MAYDGWLDYNGSEFINLSRTVQLAETMGIPSVWPKGEDVQWIEDALGGTGYDDVTNAPWYDVTYPASSEFAGLVPLSMAGLDDSSGTSSNTENTGDGGHSSALRQATQPIVASVAIVASTDRGADYGKRWMDRRLRDTGASTFCTGADLHYFRYASEDAPKVHRRNVKLTRASTVTRKRRASCDTTWFVTFTLTDNDGYEYGEPMPSLTNLGAGVPGGDVYSFGRIILSETGCPEYDYTPIYDPLYPALVPSPTAPDFYPDGWSIVSGETFQRDYARVSPPSPRDLLVVPLIKVTTTDTARMVRVKIFSADAFNEDQCGEFFSSVIMYLPAGQSFYIDGEQRASYVWDGISPSVRRADSLVYSASANPVDWVGFNYPGGILVTLDVFGDSDGYEGDGTIRVDVSFIPKSD